MKVTLRFFASLRETLGTGGLLDVPDGATAGEVRALLQRRGGVFADVLADGRAVRCAVNQTLCGPDTVVADGAEVAFFPPVTGG